MDDFRAFLRIREEVMADTSSMFPPFLSLLIGELAYPVRSGLTGGVIPDEINQELRPVRKALSR